MYFAEAQQGIILYIKNKIVHAKNDPMCYLDFRSCEIFDM